MKPTIMRAARGIEAFRDVYSGRGLVPLFFTAVMLLSVGSAPAQIDMSDKNTTGLDVEYSVGWDNHVNKSAPVPVSFLFKNFSDKPISGDVLLSDSRNGYIANLGEIYLAPQSTRRLVTIQALQDWRNCFATLITGQTIYWRRELPVNSLNFDIYTKFAMFVDANGRRIALNNPAGRNDLEYGEDTIINTSDFSVQCLNAKPWQLPDHNGPLSVIQSVVLADDLTAKDLNTLQRKTLARWVCEGGEVFVHNDSTELLEAITAQAPLPLSALEMSDGFSSRSCGLGAFRTYDAVLPDQTPAAATVRLAITRQVLKQDKEPITRMAKDASIYAREDTNSGKTVFLTVGFFIIYTLLTGFCAVMFRASRKKITTYIVVVVVSGCFVSAALGGLLRYSSGDLRWISITNLTESGAIQTAKFEVQSAGARNTRVTVNGPDVELQNITTSRNNNYYYSYQEDAGYLPFAWRTNLLRDEADAWQSSVSITPWGERQLYGSNVLDGLGQFECSVRFIPSADKDSDTTTTDRPGPYSGYGRRSRQLNLRQGTLDIQVTNSTEFEIRDCWLGLIVTPHANQNGDLHFEEAAQFIRFGDLGSGRMVKRSDQPVDLDFGWNPRERWWDAGRIQLPRNPVANSVRGWLVGRLDKSPGMNVDASRSDFAEKDQLHLVVQELDPTQLQLDNLFSPLFEEGEDEESADE